MKAGRLHQHLSGLMALCFITTACTPSAVSTRDVAGITGPTVPGTNNPPVMNPAEAPPKVEIRHLVEPKITTADYPSYYTGTGLSGAGTYVRKLTLPQNYGGFLYLGGLNIASLKNRYVMVRFTFGVAGNSVEIPATVARAPGITPNTDIDVLVMDLRSKPFRNIRLQYDLYDYKDYSLDDAPVETNRDPNLYCRALKLQDDPSFNGQGKCDGFAADGVSALVDENGDPVVEQCLYSYAKVLDRGLGKGTLASFIENFPTLMQTDQTASKLGYFAQTPDNLLKRCLPDQETYGGGHETVISEGMLNVTRVRDLNFNTRGQNGNLIQEDAFGAAVSNQPVVFLGPFKPVNTSNWELEKKAAFGEFGLFDWMPSLWPVGTFAEQMDIFALHGSKLFPRFTYLSLNKDVSYLETDINNLNSKIPMTMAAKGTSGLVDGCNARVNSVDYDGYHIGSCNASGKIEIVAYDDNNVGFTVAETNEVLLQLVRSTTISGQGDEYLYQNFKSCQNNSQCGGSECCYNKRCWNNALVAQCTDDVVPAPNLAIGQSCGNDLQCASLCCNSATGQCAVHDTNSTPPVLCNKPTGQFCLAEEWCAKSTVYDCYKVDTGLDPVTNAATCEKRCVPRAAFGQCKANTCIAPRAGIDFTFDSNASPLDCTDAGPMPDFSNQ